MIRRVRKRESASCTACSVCGSSSRLGTGSAGSGGSLDASHGRGAVQAALYLFLAASMISVQPGSALTWITDGAAAVPQQGPDAYEAAVSQLAAQANLSTDPVGWLLQGTIGPARCLLDRQLAVTRLFELKPTTADRRRPILP